MKIVFIPTGLSDDLMNFKLSEIKSTELDEILEQLKSIDNEVEITETNFGKGADLILLVATLSSIAYVISVGDKLEKGIDGWIKIGKRIYKLFPKSDKLYIDEDGAKIIAITHIAEKYNLTNIALKNSQVIYLADFSTWFRLREADCFTSKPFNIYNFSFNVNDERTIILSIKSNGEITELLNIENESLDIPF
jgi:hypothetical protein